MSFQFDPRLLLEESKQRLENTQIEIANLSARVEGGITNFCLVEGRNCSVTSERNVFSSLIRKRGILSDSLAGIENSIRILTREIELRSTPFIQPEIISSFPESIDSITTITPIQEQQNGFSLRNIAIIGAVILLLG